MISRLLVPYNTIKYDWLGNYPIRLVLLTIPKWLDIHNIEQMPFQSDITMSAGAWEPEKKINRRSEK